MINGPITIRPVTENDAAALRGLLIRTLDQELPVPVFSTVPGFTDLTGPLPAPFPGRTTMGACRGSSLVGALSFSTMADTVSECNHVQDGHITRGDTVIFWIAGHDPETISRLLEHVLARASGIVYAFPDLCPGSLAPFLAFATGMLPDYAAAITAVLHSQGFTCFTGTQWGLQERRFMYRLLSRVSFFTVENEPEDMSYTLSGPDPAGVLIARLSETNTGRNAGICQVRICGTRSETRYAFISWISVEEKWRNRGLGQFLLNRILTELHILGIYMVILTTHSGKMAHHLYIRNGFKELFLGRSYQRCAEHDGTCRHVPVGQRQPLFI